MDTRKANQIRGSQTSAADDGGTKPSRLQANSEHWLRHRKHWLYGLLASLIVLVITWWGWRTFYFLTDDSFIEFRYASNLLAGWGLTWNPPPFGPVEGYTSFSWVVLLAAVWKLFGIAPPDSAGGMSLVFGLCTLALIARMGATWQLPAKRESWRWLLVALALLGTLTNRTFFTWLSSGLESSLFNFTFTWWVFEGVRQPRSGDQERSAWRWSVAAASMALTRPDGLLAVAATLATLAIRVFRRDMSLKSGVLGAAPLLGVAAHAIWRRALYGAWLPNTYYAKNVAPWPESGMRYAASFVIEYGVWIWIALALLFVCGAVWKIRGGLLEKALARLPATAVVSVLLGHAGYYTLIIGGDHFEYRVFSHLIPLLFLSAGWFAAHLFDRRAAALGVVCAFIVCSWPIPWVHWALTHQLSTREQTHVMVRPIAPSFPAAIRGPVVLWDELQAWLIPHHVCMRHQEHKVFYQYMIEKLNTREEGARISWDERPVAADSSVGVLGWVLPNVAIIDTAGLNDWVTARTPVSQSRKLRRMAHDRGAPLRYVDCFRPNVLYSRPSIVLPRAEPLTDDDIRNCEQTYRRYTLGTGPLPAIAPSNPGKAVKTREVNEQALRVVNEALAANPSYGLYLNAGTLLLALDRSDEAEAAFHRSLELMPSGAGANAQLGKIYEQRNDMRGAAKHYAAALESKPDDPVVLASYAKVLFLLGQPDQALGALNQAIDLDPRYALAHYRRGLILQQTGRGDEARAAFREAVTLDSEFAPLVDAALAPRP